MNNHFALSDRALRTEDQPIGFLIETALANPHLISLAAGLVDYQTLPATEMRELASQLLTDDTIGHSRLNYGTTGGLGTLREQLLGHLAKLDGQNLSQFNATADQIVVTNGSQQLLALLTEALINPGDIVLTAWPSYFVYTGVLKTSGAQVRGTEIDAEGVIPEQLEKQFQSLAITGELSRVKIVYIVSYHDNPAGITLAEHRRRPILDTVKKYSTHNRILVLEDAAYRELSFDGHSPKSIRSFEASSATHQVALLQTFSKPFSPGLKVGYGLLPKELVQKILLLKDNQDFGTSHLNQHILYQAMKSGMYEKHLLVLRARYQEKSSRMLSAMQKYLGDFHPAETHWTCPTGGLYVWLTLPETMNTDRDSALFKRAVAEGVLYVPGSYCFGPDPNRKIPRNHIRLSFGTATPEEIETGIKRLATALRAV